MLPTSKIFIVKDINPFMAPLESPLLSELFLNGFACVMGTPQNEICVVDLFQGIFRSKMGIFTCNSTGKILRENRKFQMGLPFKSTQFVLLN